MRNKEREYTMEKLKINAKIIFLSGNDKGKVFTILSELRPCARTEGYYRATMNGVDEVWIFSSDLKRHGYMIVSNEIRTDKEAIFFDWTCFKEYDFQKLNFEKNPCIYGHVFVMYREALYLMDIEWETIASYDRRGISINVYRSDDNWMHQEWLTDIKTIVTAKNYRFFQKRAEKEITAVIRNVEISEGTFLNRSNRSLEAHSL